MLNKKQNKKSNTLLFSHTELKCQYYREWATETDAHQICSFCTLKLKMDLGSVDRNSWKSHKTSWPAEFRMALWILKLTTGFSSGHIQTETNMHTLSKTEKVSIQPTRQGRPERKAVSLASDTFLARLFHSGSSSYVKVSLRSPIITPSFLPKPASSTTNETSGLSDNPEDQTERSAE